MSAVRFYLVSAFASKVLTGAPAAVILSRKELAHDKRREIAKQLAQPASAFVTYPKSAEHPGPMTISWFSHAGDELPFSSSATLGAADMVLNRLFPQLSSAAFRYTKPKDGKSSSGDEAVHALLKAHRRDHRVMFQAIEKYGELHKLSVDDKKKACPVIEAAFGQDIGEDLLGQASLSIVSSLNGSSSDTLLVQLPPKFDLAKLKSHYNSLPSGVDLLTNSQIVFTIAGSESASPFQLRSYHINAAGHTVEGVSGSIRAFLARHWAREASSPIGTRTDDGAFHCLKSPEFSSSTGDARVLLKDSFDMEDGCYLLGTSKIFGEGELFLEH